MQSDLKRLQNTHIFLLKQKVQIITLRLLNYEKLTYVSFSYTHQIACHSENNLVRAESELTANV